VIAILHADDPAYVHEAAKRGVFAYIIDGTPRRASKRNRHHTSNASPNTKASKAHSDAAP